MKELSADEWWGELKAAAIRLGYGELDERSKAEWLLYFEDGCSPEDAIREDWSHA